MAKWLTTKSYERLTEAEVKAELENLLRNCEDENEFEKECRHRFGGPMIMLNWGKSIRCVTICRCRKNESISASVYLEREAVFAQRS